MTNLDDTPAGATAPPPPLVLGLWPTIFWGLGAIFLFGAAQLVGALLYFVLFNLIHPTKKMLLQEIGTDGPLIGVVTLISVPVLVGIIAWAIRRSRSSFADYLALNRPHWRDVVIGLVGLGLVLAASSLVASLVDEQTPSFMTGTFESGRDAGLLPLLAAAFVIAAPLGEELLFRGFLYRGFAERLGAPIAIGVTAVLWASLHIQYDLFFIVEIVTLGVFLGWVRWKSGSTLLTISLHALNNGLALVALAAGIN